MKSLVLMLASLMTMTSLTAHAVPELRETRGDYNGDIVTIYPDHQDPNVFYFLPNSSEFSVNTDQSPNLGLVLWGLKNGDPADGGGILSFVLQAALTEPVKKELL